MEKFEMHLRQDNMADNTITAYKHAVNEPQFRKLPRVFA